MSPIQRTDFVPGLLILEGGGEFEGMLLHPSLLLQWEDYRGFGEVVFNTGMTGYQEILSDPSYAGQMVVMTQPHIGNTGTNSTDWESGGEILCSAMIVHELTLETEHWQNEESLANLLLRKKIPLLIGVDTRALTRRLRTTGVTRGILCKREDRENAKRFLQFPLIPHADQADWLARLQSEKKSLPRSYPNQNSQFKVVALDFGIKAGLLRELEARGCLIEILPATTSPAAILARSPDGLFLSNGPGDPSKAIASIQNLRDLLGKIPIFGVCMGHQVLGQALGAKTYKLKFGHRGANQPVLNHQTGKVEISSHNHGYAVDASTLPPSVCVTHSHLNDHSVEGLRWQPATGLAPAFSVQYHPEASPGPHDSAYCFDEFVEDMTRWQKKSSAPRDHLEAQPS